MKKSNVQYYSNKTDEIQLKQCLMFVGNVRFI